MGPAMTTSDPAVRSIQIATTLVERLAELLKPRRTDGLASVVGSAASDGLELRIGEAQQIAPEIWRHLDDARRVFVEGGIDVADYDLIRSEQNPALLATRNIDVSRKLDLLGLIQGQFKIVEKKSVEWDTGGLVRAVAACVALKAKRRDVDWDALERAERAQIAAAGSLKSAKWKATGKWIALGVAIAAVAVVIYIAFGRGDPQADAAAAKEREKAALIEKAVAERKAKIAEYRDKLSAAPCDVAIKDKLIAYLLADHQTPEANVVEQMFAVRCAGAPTEPAAPAP
jgi:hypothetical protein